MNKKYLACLFVLAFFLTSCAIYTEKRSQALSRAVAATVDSIDAARFDLAEKYSKEAEKIAYPPKTRIIVRPVVTKDTKSIEIKNSKTEISAGNRRTQADSSIVKVVSSNGSEQMILRLVVPEKLKHAKLLIENSEEWNELLKTKDFSEQLKTDNLNLKKLTEEIRQALIKEKEINEKMIVELNKLQKEVLKKNLHIVKLYIVVAILILAIGGGIYLRIKGIL